MVSMTPMETVVTVATPLEHSAARIAAPIPQIYKHHVADQTRAHETRAHGQTIKSRRYEADVRAHDVPAEHTMYPRTCQHAGAMERGLKGQVISGQQLCEERFEPGRSESEGEGSV